MIPHAVLTESGAARVVTVALHAGRIRLRPGTIFIEPDLTMGAFDAANPKGADYVIVPALLDPHHFLDLRLGLQHEIFRTATAPKHHAAAATRAFRAEHEGGSLIDVDGRIYAQFIAA